MPVSGMRRKLQATMTSPWLRLIRLPNVFTVPGDPITGALLSVVGSAGGGNSFYIRVAICAAVSTALYCGGLILNDLCDLRHDRDLRPERPLPRREISIPAAWGAYWALLGTALLMAATLGRRQFLITCLLAGTVAVYNTLAKKNRLQGALAMGLCRAMSFLLGASLGIAQLNTFLCAGILGLFIAAVTWIAWAEDRAHCPGNMALIPGGALVAIWLIRAVTLSADPIPFLIGSVVLAGALLKSCDTGRKLSVAVVPAATVQAAIGTFLRALPAWQIFLALSAPVPGHTITAMLLGIFWACSLVFGRHISQS